jgi:hypothetical protein
MMDNPEMMKMMEKKAEKMDMSKMKGMDKNPNNSIKTGTI